MSGKKILICKECGAECDHDEINYLNLCIDCENLFCELGEEYDESATRI